MSTQTIYINLRETCSITLLSILYRISVIYSVSGQASDFAPACSVATKRLSATMHPSLNGKATNRRLSDQAVWHASSVSFMAMPSATLSVSIVKSVVTVR